MSKMQTRKYIKIGKENRLYQTWINMKKRCYDSRILKYKRYGARGVKFCDSWLKFENFVDWALENGYQNDLQIDRIDGDKDYCPENCRWVTPKVQSNNRKYVNKIELNGLVKNKMNGPNI